MVIIPTEKRFDWKHAPVMLFFIVILNILIFFIFQSADDEKINDALNSYYELGYFESEWPIFVKYLKYKKKESQLIDFQRLYRRNQKNQLSYWNLNSD